MRSCCPSMAKADMKILEAERLHQPMMTRADTVPKVPLQQRPKRWLSTPGEKGAVESQLPLKCPWYMSSIHKMRVKGHRN